MPSATATVDIDERGRMTIPKAARKRLGIVGEGAEGAEVTVEVKDD